MLAWPKTGFAAIALALCLGATTLQQLGLDEMIQKSTGVVRGRVTGSYTVARGQDIYTFYQLQVTEEWKGGTGLAQLDLAIPGGSAGGKRQVVAGSPALTTGQDYVLFYWTGRSGLRQVMGLSQGLFSEVTDGTANPVLVRPAATETMLDKDGNVVQDQALSLRVADLRDRVKRPASK